MFVQSGYRMDVARTPQPITTQAFHDAFDKMPYERPCLHVAICVCVSGKFCVKSRNAFLSPLWPSCCAFPSTAAQLHDLTILLRSCHNTAAAVLFSLSFVCSPRRLPRGGSTKHLSAAATWPVLRWTSPLGFVEMLVVSDAIATF